MKNISLITISLAFHRQRFGSLNRNLILSQLLLRLSYRILIEKVFRGQIKLNSFILTFEFVHRRGSIHELDYCYGFHLRLTLRKL